MKKAIAFFAGFGITLAAVFTRYRVKNVQQSIWSEETDQATYDFKS